MRESTVRSKIYAAAVAAVVSVVTEDRYMVPCRFSLDGPVAGVAIAVAIAVVVVGDVVCLWVQAWRSWMCLR